MSLSQSVNARCSTWNSLGIKALSLTFLSAKLQRNPDICMYVCTYFVNICKDIPLIIVNTYHHLSPSSRHTTAVAPPGGGATAGAAGFDS